jgi:fatty-acyl-CoA synthase
VQENFTSGYLRGRIACYEVPRSFRFVKELPRTPVGEIVKHRLLTSPE